MSEELAIEGGTPTLGGDIDFSWPISDDSIRAAVNEALNDGTWGMYDARWTENLVQRLQSFFQSEHVMLASSGTIAVELALRGCGVQADDEVIMAGYDFPGNFRAVEAIHARPVLVDVVENGWVIDPSQLAEAFSEKTKALIVSHLHGQTADIRSIRNIVSQRNETSESPISIVEDACQVPGGKLDDRTLGTFGDVGVLSFGGSKLLSAGRGGAIVSNDANIIQRARIFSNRGNDAFPLSQLQAAVLGPQLEKLDSMTQTRSANAAKLIESTASNKDLIGLSQVVDNVVPAYYKLPWLLKDRTPGWSRVDFVQALEAEGVPAGEGFRGFLRRSPRRCRKVGTLVNCQIASQQTVLLGHPALSKGDEVINLIAKAIAKVASNPQ